MRPTYLCRISGERGVDTSHSPTPKDFAETYSPEKIPLPRSLLPVHPFNNGELTVRDEKLLSWPRKPAEVKKQIAAYYGMISHMDAEIGRIHSVRCEGTESSSGGPACGSRET